MGDVLSRIYLRSAAVIPQPDVGAIDASVPGNTSLVCTGGPGENQV